METIIVIVAIAVIGILGIAMYNKLIRLKNAVDEGFAQIDVQLQRRNDLIPNLVETVKGYASHEREALEAVINARNLGMNATSTEEKIKADNAVTGALRQLFALAEAYPDLKASANFVALQEELATTENKLAFARQRYNDQVRDLNTAIETIPTRFVAGIAKATKAVYFETEDAARAVPKISFGA
jgi:LemA protein